jgi:hypothetical protein
LASVVILVLLLLTGLDVFYKKKVWADVGGEIEDQPQAAPGFKGPG